VKPEIYEMLVEKFDAKITASNLEDSAKKFLKEGRIPSAPPKKT
jgi:hypothetical protein